MLVPRPERLRVAARDVGDVDLCIERCAGPVRLHNIFLSDETLRSFTLTRVVLGTLELPGHVVRALVSDGSIDTECLLTDEMRALLVAQPVNDRVAIAIRLRNADEVVRYAKIAAIVSLATEPS